MILRPIERFLAQWIAVSTAPTAFVRERIRLGDTTNFLRASGFFLSAISAAFLAEVATLYILGIGGLTEPYYWLFILLTSIPFVLFCFLLLRFVAPLSFKDVLHLSLIPVGAGVFTGAAFALVASTVVAMLAAFGYISDIRIDYSQWTDVEEQGVALFQRALRDCHKEKSLVYTVLTTGLQVAYDDLKPPIDALSFLRPIIAALYLFMAACFFRAAVDRRKSVVFGLVLLAALVATGANFLWLRAYFEWSYDPSCQKRMEELAVDRTAESALKQFAADFNSDKDNQPKWDVTYRAEGRVLYEIWRAKLPGLDLAAFHRGVSLHQKSSLKHYCSDDSKAFRDMKATVTRIFYSLDGERLMSFSISPADCAQW